MDVQLDVSRDGYAGRLEVTEGPTGRRRRSAAERTRIAAESLMPGVRVTDVVRRHRVSACLKKIGWIWLQRRKGDQGGKREWRYWKPDAETK